MASICLHLVVKGRVQGVWFRRFAQEHALSNGVTGWVRNRSDTCVEALLCGDERSVRHVEAWLSRGPELASVIAVEAQLREFEQWEAFVIREDAD